MLVFNPTSAPVPKLLSLQVKTGEEDEEVMFAERARLYRFDKDTSQWKERGLGVLKILRNATQQQYRVVMRRDQVHKLCANHLLSADMELKPMQVGVPMCAAPSQPLLPLTPLSPPAPKHDSNLFSGKR